MCQLTEAIQCCLAFANSIGIFNKCWRKACGSTVIYKFKPNNFSNFIFYTVQVFSGFLKYIFEIINVIKAVFSTPHFLLMRKDGKANILTRNKKGFWKATSHTILINKGRFYKGWINVSEGQEKIHVRSKHSHLKNYFFPV